MYMMGFFLFSCFALLLMQPLQCCAAADKAGLIRSTHVMMLRAISIPILALCVSPCSDNAQGYYWRTAPLHPLWPAAVISETLRKCIFP